MVVESARCNTFDSCDLVLWREPGNDLRRENVERVIKRSGMNHSNKNRPSMDALEEFFLQAIQISSLEERKAHVDKACGGDIELRTKLDQMLKAHFEEDEFLDSDRVANSIVAVADSPKSYGEFDVIQEIGRGGMGIVYEAQQISLNRRVALKVLSVGLDFSKTSIARFQREAEAAARLHHTNIVPIHTTGVENQIPFYAMDFVRGPSLDRVLDQLRGEASSESGLEASIGNVEETSDADRRWESDTITNSLDSTPSSSSSLGTGTAYFDNVARMFAEVADALEHAHQEGVIHRDIKPSNLLLGPDGRIHVSDFGLARILEEPTMTTTGELMGSPRYMSPEQISVETGDEVDHRSDIYSLGVTLYELITLQPAYDAKERDRIYSQILNKEPTAPRKINTKVPADLETICQKAIEKAPADRYETAADMAEDLRRFVNRRSVLAKKISWLNRSVNWYRRNRTLALVAAILCIVLLSSVTWFTVQESRRHREWNLVVGEIESSIDDDAWRARLLIESALQRFPQRYEELDSLLSRVGREMTIESEPAGAQIFVRPARFETGNWLALGTTPLKTNLPTYPFQDYHVRAQFNDHEELIVRHTTGAREIDNWQLRISSQPEMALVGPATSDAYPNAARVAWLHHEQKMLLQQQPVMMGSN